MPFRSGREEAFPQLQARREDSYPYPYPSGWYRIGSRDSVRPGEVRYIECLGKEFVLWRERQRGEIHLMDAFCPHLGANLGRGRVRGDCIECPYHQWQFTGDGRVESIPYSEHPPTGPLARGYPLEDVHGELFLFHRADWESGSDSDPPLYPAPRFPEVDEGGFAKRGHRNVGRVAMHIIDFPENAADLAHFPMLHGQFSVPGTRIQVPKFDFVHNSRWAPDEDLEWQMQTVIDTYPRILGREFPNLRVRTQSTFYGPGGIALVRISFPGSDVGIAMFQTQLPVGPLEQQVDYTLTTPGSPIPSCRVGWSGMRSANGPRSFRTTPKSGGTRSSPPNPCFAETTVPYTSCAAGISSSCRRSPSARP